MRRRGPGRPPVVDREAIAAAVLDVGFPELTFAAVATRLGVGQATVYRHVPNRDELVRAGLDLAFRRRTWPPLRGHWRTVLEEYALAAWRAFEAHPGAATESTRGIVPPVVLRMTGELGGFLIEAGFTPADAVLACDVVFDLVADSRRGVEHLDQHVDGGDGHGRERIENQWSAVLGQEDVGPGAVHRAMLDAIRAAPVEWFTRKLRLVLAGIEAELAPGREPSADDAGRRPPDRGLPGERRSVLG